MGYSEHISIILMRDKGPRRSFRLPRWRFFFLVGFFAFMPFFCALLCFEAWLLFEQNAALGENLQRFENERQLFQARAERLEHLEALLKESSVPARELILRKLAHAEAPDEQGLEKGQEKLSEARENPPETPKASAESAMVSDGPGHEDFPSLDTGRVIVDNVEVRALRGHSLRLALDLRNPEKQELLAGTVSAFLVTAEGQKVPLNFSPADVGNFRINRFKRTVMIAVVDSRFSLVNAQVIVEVKEDRAKLLYRNIFAVQH